MPRSPKPNRIIVPNEPEKFSKLLWEVAHELCDYYSVYRKRDLAGQPPPVEMDGSSLRVLRYLTKYYEHLPENHTVSPDRLRRLNHLAQHLYDVVINEQNNAIVEFATEIHGFAEAPGSKVLKAARLREKRDDFLSACDHIVYDAGQIFQDLIDQNATSNKELADIIRAEQEIEEEFVNKLKIAAKDVTRTLTKGPGKSPP
jgi:hypothetical protein